MPRKKKVDIEELTEAKITTTKNEELKNTKKATSAKKVTKKANTVEVDVKSNSDEPKVVKKRTAKKKDAAEIDSNVKSDEIKVVKKRATKKKDTANIDSNVKNDEIEVVKKRTTKKKDAVNVDEKAKSVNSKVTKKKTASKKSPKISDGEVVKTTSKKRSIANSSSRKSSSKKSASTKIASTSMAKKPVIDVVEYYDLPYRYNQTIVKVLYQTPNMLFIYWDISDMDRINLVNKYGDNFFDYTKPVLILHNKTLNYSFEVEIDDFANSWYLHVDDANCEYLVELGRRPKYVNNQKQLELPNDYIYVTTSNNIELPNDHVLFDKTINTVFFKDVKTNIVTEQSIVSISYIRNMGKIYSLFDLKTDFGKNNFERFLHLDLTNPSSSNPTSSMG